MRGSFLCILSSDLTIIAWLRQDIALARAIFCRSQAQNEVWYLGIWNGGLLQILEPWIEVSTSHYTFCSLKCCNTAGYPVCNVSSHTTLTLHHTTLFFAIFQSLRLSLLSPSVVWCSVSVVSIRVLHSCKSSNNRRLREFCVV